MAKTSIDIKSIDLELRIEDSLPDVNIDPDRTTQALNNLLTNAVKYSNADSSVVISASLVRRYVEISVEDHGQGIPPDEMDKLFTIFGRTSTRPTQGETSVSDRNASIPRGVMKSWRKD